MGAAGDPGLPGPPRVVPPGDHLRQARHAQLAELGPGRSWGSALLEHGRRTATLTAVTDCLVAAVGRDHLDRDSLASLAGQHYREA